jgi:hypothetical protein
VQGSPFTVHHLIGSRQKKPKESGQGQCKRQARVVLFRSKAIDLIGLVGFGCSFVPELATVAALE